VQMAPANFFAFITSSAPLIGSRRARAGTALAC
jgi:hypothetical protein